MTELVVFTYDGRDVIFNPGAQTWNLTAMHRATGANPHKAPAQWLRTQAAQDLIAALAARLNYADLHSLDDETIRNYGQFIETREGRNGGTWAHWQIAAAYAHYLSPDFYLQWNEWAMERYQQLSGQNETIDAAALADITARLAALEAAQAARPAAPAVVVVGKALDDLALAIIEVLESSDFPRAPREIARLLTAQGWDNLNKDRMKSRMARLARRGVIHKIGHGLYALRPWDDDTNISNINPTA